MSDIIKKLQEQINEEKEIIDTLPRKGIKKLRDLHSKLDDLIEEYGNVENDIIKEMENKYNKIVDIKENSKIKVLEKQLEDLDNIAIESDGKTSFEKLQLDRIIYDINGYYKKDLEITNQNIFECIENFRKTGLNINAEDFKISAEVYNYIKILLQEAEKGNINSQAVKKAFEESYWKCSELLYQILVNIRQIYDKNESHFKKYFILEKQKMDAAFDYQDIKIRKEKLVKEYEDLINSDAKNILEKFFDKSLNISEYKKENYNSVYTKLVKGVEENENILLEDIKKLNSNLLEYQNYLQYKFICDEVLRIKEEVTPKEENKNTKKDNKKNKSEIDIVKEEIKNIEKENIKINKAIEESGKKKFFIKKISKNEVKKKILERDKNIMKLRDLYMKIDDIKLRNGIMKNIDNATTILEVLVYASYNYGFLARTLIKNNSEITDKEIANQIHKFRMFLRMEIFSVLNNIRVDEKKDISIIIKDKYTLTGFNLSKDDFTETAIEDLIKQTEIIKNYVNIQKSSITIEEITFALQAKEILNV